MDICFAIMDSNYCLSTLLIAMQKALTSTFGLSAIGAFAGAAGGALAILQLESRKNHQDLLSTINYNSASLTGHINTLLGMKKQLFIPLEEEIKHTDGIIANSQKGKEVDLTHMRIMMESFPEIDNDFMLNLDQIRQYCHISTAHVEHGVRAKEALLSVANRISQRNSILEELKDDSNPVNEKIIKYFNLIPNNTSNDRRLRTLSHALLNDTDAALWFMLRTQKELRKLGEKALPKKTAKKLAKFEFSEGYGDLLPPDNYLEWEA